MPNEMDHFTTDHCGSKYQVKLEMRTIAEFEHKSDRDLFMSALRNLQPASNNELTDCQRRVKELEGLLASHEQQLESEQISKGNFIHHACELHKACKLLLRCSLPNDISGMAMIDEAKKAIENFQPQNTLYKAILDRSQELKEGK